MTNKTNAYAKGQSCEQQRNKEPPKSRGNTGAGKQQDEPGGLNRDIDLGRERLTKLWEHAVAL